MTKATLFAITILLTLSTTTFSQSFGFKCGLNLSTIHSEYSESNYNGDYVIGFHIGGFSEFSISRNTVLEPELLLTTKGFSEKGLEMDPGEPIYNTKLTATLYYIDLPINVKRYIYIGKTKLYGTLGTYVGLGLIGKTKEEFWSTTEESKPDIINYIDMDNERRRFDFGLTAGAGITFNSIQIGISYNLGLANSSQISEGRVYNREFNLSIGYLLGMK